MNTSSQSTTSNTPMTSHQNNPNTMDLTQGTPGSPDILEPATPPSPSNPIIIHDDDPEDMEMLTPADPSYNNDRQAVSLNDRDDTVQNENLSESAYSGNTNSSDTIVLQLDARDRNQYMDENSNVSSVSFVILGEDSNTNMEVQTNEESNDSASLPEAEINKTDTNTNRGPPAKVRKIGTPPKSPINDTDGETCPICLDSWGNSGDHRLVALKCGHLFGLKCVERWLKAQPNKERLCPTCKRKATLKDLRFIYARRLVAADTSEVTALQKQLEVLQADKIRTELELQKSKIAHRACIFQIESLKNSLMKTQVEAIKERLSKRTWRFALEKNLEVSKDGGCRVMTYNCRTYELYVSQKSGNNLFPGYGIRKVSCVDYNLGQFIHLHLKPIRDITYSQPRDLLLSVGLDSTARIVERGIPSTMVNVGFPVWSCCWDSLRNNEFYVGGVGGNIHQYDIRNTRSSLQRLFAPGDISPVVSIRSTEYGMLSCHLNSSWLWLANSSGQWEPRALPVEGPFMSLSYENESRRALFSCRPKASQENSRLTLCKLLPTESGEVTCQVEQTFYSSSRTSYMSRAVFVNAPGVSWAAAHSESQSSLFLHGLDGVRTMSLPAAEPALDVLSVHLNGDTVLSSLSESRLRIYKAMASIS